MSRVFANGLGDRGSVPDRVISKTSKMVLDAALFNLCVVAIEKGALGSPSTTVSNFILLTYFWESYDIPLFLQLWVK